MSEYGIFANGKEYNEIWANGKEYTEVWTLVNGVKTKIWSRFQGLKGGFYNEDGECILEWDKTHYFVNYGRRIPFSIPNSTDNPYLFTECHYLNSTINYLFEPSVDDKPIDAEDITKIVVPSTVTVWSGAYSRISESYSSESKRNLKEVLFLDGTSDLTINVDSFLYHLPKLEKVTMPSNLTAFSQEVFAYEIGRLTNEGAIIDLSKTKITKFPKFMYSNIKKIIVPNTITSIVENAISYINKNSDIYIEEINLPNVHDYPRLGYNYKIESLVIPENSIVSIEMGYQSGKIKHFTFGNNCVLNYSSVRCEGAERIDFNGNSVTLSSGSIQGYDECSTYIDFADSISKIKRKEGSDPLAMVDISEVKEGFYIHLPSSLTSIEDYTFSIRSYDDNSIEVINIPYSCNHIGKYGVYVSNRLGVKFENPNGWYFIKTLDDGTTERVDVDGLEDPFVAGQKLSSYSYLEWFRE